MTDQPALISVEEVEEHEDGSATFKFHMDDKAKDAVLKEGLKILLLCGAYKVDIADVCNWIESHAV